MTLSTEVSCECDEVDLEKRVPPSTTFNRAVQRPGLVRMYHRPNIRSVGLKILRIIVAL